LIPSFEPDVIPNAVLAPKTADEKLSESLRGDDKANEKLE